MDRKPTLKDLESYDRVKEYLAKGDFPKNNFSILPKRKWPIAVILAIVAFLCYYALTTLLFGQDFWVLSITGGY